MVVPDDGSEERAYPVSKRSRLIVEEGQHVEVGEKLIVGAANPHEVLRILGQRKVQSTWSRRSRRSTARRACRSTTSTSRSSFGRCCAA